MNIFVYERHDWPNFRWDSDTVSEKLAAVRYRQGRFQGRMLALGFQVHDEAALEALTEEVQKSSQIEGELLDREKVRSSIARRLGLETASLLPVDRQIEGIVDVLMDATGRYAEPLTINRLYSWHGAMFPTGYSGLLPITVGHWRTDREGPMQIVSGPYGREKVHYVAPAASRLEHEMEMFLKWFEATDQFDLVLKAALSHLWFVTIHPFDDGNGRIARALSDMMLARSENSAQRFYSMSAQIQKERKAYYQCLETTQKGDLDVTKWIVWFLDCLDRAIEYAEDLLSAVFAKANFWDAYSDVPMNERQKAMLNKLLDGFSGNLTTSKWAKITKVSSDTALRDIKDLIEKNILTANSPAGRSTNYSLKNTD